MSNKQVFEVESSEVSFGDVEWIKNPYGTEIYDTDMLEAIAVKLGTIDPVILSSVEIGRVIRGTQKGRIIGFKNLPEGFVSTTIKVDDMPFCEYCRALDSKQEYLCNSCNTRMCGVCRDSDECCDKYETI